MTLRRWIPLRVAVYNGHVGIPIANGALSWLLARYRLRRPHIWLLQEVRDAARARLDLPAESWWWVPVEQPGRTRDEEAMTYVVARRRRFLLLSAENADVTFGEKHPRRRTTATLFDRRTSRAVTVSSLHVAPLGAGFAHADPRARRRHEEQVQAYADRHEKVPAEYVSIVGGDTNERISGTVPANLAGRTVVARLGRAGLTPVSHVTGDAAGLDDVFVRIDPHVRVVGRLEVTPPVRGNDHPSVLARLRVRRASTPTTR